MTESLIKVYCIWTAVSILSVGISVLFTKMFPNVFSIAPDLVVSDEVFTRLNRHLTEEWGIKVEEISYREISKMGGLLRCSTMPLIRE